MPSSKTGGSPIWGWTTAKSPRSRQYPDRITRRTNMAIVSNSDFDNYVDQMDSIEARRYFGVPLWTGAPALAVHVLGLTGTSVHYGDLSFAEAKSAQWWAIALGSFPPRGTITTGDSRAASAARLAFEIVQYRLGSESVSALAKRLLPSASERDPSIVLAVLGARVYAKSVIVVADADQAVDDIDYDEVLVEDRYSELADRTPGTELLED